MNLAEQFDSLSLADLNNYVSSGELENLTLEFKTVNRSELDRNDRKI
jgi:hypothetical protein